MGVHVLNDCQRSDIEWNDRIEEATQRILHKGKEDPDKWWDAVEIYATAAEVPDKSSQALA